MRINFDLSARGLAGIDEQTNAVARSCLISGGYSPLSARQISSCLPSKIYLP